MRRKNKDIYRSITELLEQGSYNILQIAKHTNTNWETAKNILKTLESINLIAKTDKGYTLKTSLTDNNTLFNLPVKNAQLTQAIANSIPEEGIKKEIILVKVIKKAKLNIPYGWYLTHERPILNLKPSDKTTSRYNHEIKEAVKECPKDLKSYYIEEGKDLYLTKLKIENAIIEGENDLLKTLVRNMLFSTPEDEHIQGFASLATRLNIKDIRTDVYNAFEAVWDIIAAYNLRESVKQFYDPSMIKINTQKADEYLTILASHLPKEKTDSLSRFKGIQARQSR